MSAVHVFYFTGCKERICRLVNLQHLRTASKVLTSPLNNNQAMVVRQNLKWPIKENFLKASQIPTRAEEQIIDNDTFSPKMIVHWRSLQVQKPPVVDRISVMTFITFMSILKLKQETTKHFPNSTTRSIDIERRASLQQNWMLNGAEPYRKYHNISFFQNSYQIRRQKDLINSPKIFLN